MKNRSRGIAIGLCLFVSVIGAYNNSTTSNNYNEVRAVSENLGNAISIEVYKEAEKGDEESQFVVKQKTSLPSQIVSTNILSNNSVSSNEKVDKVNCELLQFPQLNDEDIYYLKKIATCEAGDVDVHTISLVMLVVLNRVKSPKFPNTVYEVIMQRGQFTVCKPGGKWYTTEPNDKSDEAFNVIWDTLYDYSEGALYFESYSSDEVAKNSWFGKKLEYLYKSGGTRFYK